jgi:hypothetical protein
LKRDAAKWQNLPTQPSETQLNQDGEHKMSNSMDNISPLHSLSNNQQTKGTSVEAISCAQDMKERNATTGSFPVDA